MSDTNLHMVAGVEIPAEADEYRFHCADACGRMGFELEGVEWIAAAILDRIAAEWDGGTHDVWWFSKDLRRRASELRGETVE